MVADRRFVRHRAACAAAFALTLVACRDHPTSSPEPRGLSGASVPAQATVASTLSPTFAVRGADGEMLSGVPVTITVTAGEGVIRNAPLRTAAGPTPVGQWILGTVAGRNAVTITVGSLLPLVLEVKGVPDAPVGLSAVRGGEQSGLAGDVLPGEIAFKLHDRFGNGIPGASISLLVTGGGGQITPAVVRSEENGVASGATWRLGRTGGMQTLLAVAGALSTSLRAEIRSDFLPEVRFFGGTPSAEIRAAFIDAAARIRASVVGEVDDVPMLNFDMSRCGVPGVTLNETVDEVLIFATVTTIDGPGRILGSAGPCITRSLNRFTVIGVMRFDVDDVNVLVSSGRFTAVALHEMLHIVGVGTIWRAKNLLFGGGSTNPRFGGPLAANLCVFAGGEACTDGTVPVENTGNPGTADAHWRESTFDSELMTGFAESTPNMPLSAITLASLEDLGLVVNLFAADPYTVPVAAAGASPRIAPSALPPWEVLEFPRFEVTSAGWIRPTIQR